MIEWSARALAIFKVAEEDGRSLTPAECRILNAELEPYNRAQLQKMQAEMDRKVAAHETLSEEEIEDFFKGVPPAGYVRSDLWMGDLFMWKGDGDALG